MVIFNFSKKCRISDSEDDCPMAVISNLSDTMLVLTLGFLIFDIMALSANQCLISNSQFFSRCFFCMGYGRWGIRVGRRSILKSD